MTVLMSRVAGMPYIMGYDSPELKPLSFNPRIRIFPRTSKFNIDDIQNPYNYLPKANELYERTKSTKIADKFDVSFNYYKPDMYNLTSAGEIEEFTKKAGNRKLQWRERLKIIEASIREHGNSWEAPQLMHFNGLVDVLSNYGYLNSNRVAHAEEVKNRLDNIRTLLGQLNKKHYSAAYKEAYDDLEQKTAEVVQIPTAMQYTRNCIYGRAAKTTNEVLGYFVGAALIFIGGLFAGNNLSDLKNQAKINALKAQTIQMSEINRRVEDYENKIESLEAQIKEIKESQHTPQTLTIAEQKIPEALPKEAQEIALPKIPVQKSAPKTNFTFGHNTEKILNTYSSKERSAIEHIVTAMDYKDPSKALSSLKRAKTYVDASGNRILASFYEGYFGVLEQAILRGEQQNAVSDNERYDLLFNTIPPSQQAANSTGTKAKSLEAKVKQEDKAKKTFWKKTGDVIWNYTPVSLLSIPEWGRHPWVQTIKLVTTYFAGKGFGWWGKHAGGEAAAVAGGNDGSGGGGLQIPQLLEQTLKLITFN